MSVFTEAYSNRAELPLIKETALVLILKENIFYVIGIFILESHDSLRSLYSIRGLFNRIYRSVVM